MHVRTLLILVAICCSASVHANERERNKHVAREFFEEVLSKGNFDQYAESHSQNFVAHGEHEASLQEDIAAAREERQALPDMSFTVRQLVAEDDLVAVYWAATGTNTQAGMGFPATGKKIKFDGTTLFRFRKGKIIEEWSIWDMYSIMRQAGLIALPK